MFENVPDKDLKYVGKDHPRIDAVEKITGEATYVSDMALPGMLHCQVVKSPHARAKIKNIDTSKALALPGVRAVVTGEELDYRVGLYLVDKYILAKDEVRHYGEAVAAVAADDLRTAKKAADLIRVEYEVLDAVLHPADAMKEDAPLVHPDLGDYDCVKAAFTPVPGTNIANHMKVRKGDVEKGFEEADYVIEREYTCPSVQHVPMETHVAIVQWEKNDNVTIWSSAQSPFTVRNLFCHSFKIPHNNVRVLVPHIGGGFGGKAGVHLEPLLAVLSKLSGGKPVKLQASREEEFSMLPCRSALVNRIKTGVMKSGKIVAQKIEMLWDAGAYADYAVNVTRASGYSAAGPYEVPNAWVDAYTIYTNKPFGTAFRGFGHVEFFWGLERHMDLSAQVIEMDPLEFRKINALRPGDTTLTGESITDHHGDVTTCMAAVAEDIGYGSLSEEEKEREKKSGWKIGKAVAALHKAPAMPPYTATAFVLKMNEDGTVVANLALTDMGQGTYTALQQILAEALGFPFEKIKIAYDSDTDRDPYDWQSVASKGLLLSGNAAILAAEDLIKNAYDVASQALKANPRDLAHDGEKIYIKHQPSSSVTFAELAVGYSEPGGSGIGGPIMGFGRYMAQGLTALDKETGQGHPAVDWTYGAHGVTVEVNTETGEYNILKISSSFDVGKVINPGAVRGQAIGGMIQGLGTAICEGYVYDEKGRLLNPNFTDNKIPTSMDIPEVIGAIAVETPQLDGPFGARGVGEHAMISVASALGNAIQAATGAELLHMPIRNEDIWRALNNKTSIDNWITKDPMGSCRSVPEPGFIA